MKEYKTYAEKKDMQKEKLQLLNTLKYAVKKRCPAMELFQ